MKNRVLLISIRYLSIILIIFTMILYNKTLISMFSVGIILLYIINNQVRFFNFQQKEVCLILSILLEWLIAYISFAHHGGMLFFYFLPSVLDGAFFLKEYKAKMFSFLAIIAVVVIGRNIASRELLITTFSLITLIALSNYIKEEVQGKLKAQELYDKLRISEEELKKAKEDIEAYASSIEELTLLRERNRISREIHDSVGHSLSTAIIQLGAIEKMAKTNGEMASTLAKNLGDFVKESLQEVRGAVRALKPREFEKYEGILAIEELVKNFQKLTGVKVNLRYSKQSWNLNSDHSFVIYRVIQEFMSNSLRHGKATEISIFMHFNQDNLIITLRDNGVGTQRVTKGIGLQSIWERVKELRGEISYDTEINKGFNLKVVLHPNDTHETSNVAFAVEDRGEYGHKFLEKVQANGSKSIFSSKEQALEALRKNNVLAVYIIPENFTEEINKGIKPEIQSFKREEGNGTSFIEATMEEELIKLTKAKFLSSKGIINGEEEISTTIKIKEEKIQGKNQVLYMIILMITSFILFSANSVGTELISMKKQKVLFRSITTSNTGYEIMGGLYLGFFLVQAIIYMAVLFIQKVFLGFSFEGLLPILLINMLLTVLISVSIGLAVTRVVENEGVAALIINLFGIITTFVSMAATVMAGDNMPQIIKSIGKFTPQYWVINSMDTGTLFPNAIILALMAAAVFTAGSFRIRSFVNK